MRITGYIKDRLCLIIVNLLGIVLLTLLLLAAGNTLDIICLIAAAWLLCLSVGIMAGYRVRKRYLSELLELSDKLEERYLLSEVMEKPDRSDDAVFYQLMKSSHKSMLEEIAKIRLEQKEYKEYKEYIEQWVHEAKAPVTALKLLCENQKSDDKRAFLTELERMNHYIEQTLYFARSEHTEKDYLIRELKLMDMVHQALAENKQLLLKQKVQIKLEESGLTAYTDEKWLVFILNQLIQNAVKYRSNMPVLAFRTEQTENTVILTIADNGIGISKNELPRIFEKGFTGTNGRMEKHSTGMGLYLCRKLCDRLGVGILASSEEGKGTSFSLIFYKNQSLLTVL
ncbi:MAG: sensor histidine kinase [Lachnospiraceae bacterium]|nr:sensor histidine kinase [Lachnospiraceae bacterium]